MTNTKPSGRRILPVAASYGNLTVQPNSRTQKMNASYFLCTCSCGNTREVRADKLRNGKVTACAECNYSADRERRKKEAPARYSLTLHRLKSEEKRIIPRIIYSLEALKEAAQLSAQQMLATGVPAITVKRYLAIPTSVIPNP